MINVGEQLVASYLRYIRKCDFIQTNLYTVDTQGEIDVVGISLKENKVYICEVAVHLTTGLQYVKEKRPNNVQKLIEKFSRDIEYARKYLAKYEPHYMLWSPIVKNSKGQPLNNQIGHLAEISKQLETQYNVTLECIVNEKFLSCLKELRQFAGGQTSELQCPLLRLLQIEEYLEKHVARTSAKTEQQIFTSVAVPATLYAD